MGTHGIILKNMRIQICNWMANPIHLQGNIFEVCKRNGGFKFFEKYSEMRNFVNRIEHGDSMLSSCLDKLDFFLKNRSKSEFQDRTFISACLPTY
jgi:hypothetical protein